MIADLALNLVQSQFGDYQIDLALNSSENDLASEEGLRTAVLISLLSDARVEYDDDPNFSGERRGFWLEMITGEVWGSKLWILQREKQSESTRIRAEEYAESALQWLIDDSIASAVSVTASYTAVGILHLAVSILRPKRDNLELEFDYVWRAEENR